MYRPQQQQQLFVNTNIF